MPFMYSARGGKVQLDVSPNDIAVRFRGETGPATAKAAFRGVARSAARAKTSAPESMPRQYDRFMLIHDTNAAAAPVATVVNALPRAHAARASRTLPVFKERESGLRFVATDEIVVRLRPRSKPARLRKLLVQHELILRRRSEFGPGQFIVALPADRPSGSRTLDLANALAEADDVLEFAAPNFLAETRKYQIPNDPLLGDQWHLINSGANGGLAGEDVDAAAAWALTPGGVASIVIAIIDDGVELKHPDLRANIWTNPNRKARDKHGRDFFDESDPYNPEPRVFNPPFDDTDRNDIHGTPCAGVAAAVGANGKGVCGIAYQCKILPVKILGGPGIAPVDRIADAIRYAGKKADVLSCSWGVARHPDIETAIDDVVSTGRGGKGCPIFVATGNDSAQAIGFPSSHPEVFAVGASNDRGRRSSYSNYGKGIAFVAPSSDDVRQGITTTDLSKRNRGYRSGSAYTDDFGGTSSATPLAAGIAGLVLSVNPGLGYKQVGALMKATAEKIGGSGAGYGSSGHSLRYGYGRVNAHGAVQAALKAKSKGKGKGRRKGAGKRKK
jgi:subtilisin family serine protease